MRRILTGGYCHPTALVESDSIGDGTRIWAYAHIMNGAIVGANCNIGDHCFLESGVVLGDGVIVKNGVSVWTGVTVLDRVFIGPSVVFTNDLRPRARIPTKVLPTIIGEGASLGANATIVCGCDVGRFALVGAGAVVTRRVADFGLVVGNPARLVGYVCRCGQSLHFVGPIAVCDCGISYSRSGSGIRQQV